MRPPPSAPANAAEPLSAAKRRLLVVLEKVLGSAMGIRPFAPRVLFGPPSPVSLALAWLLPYIPLAAAAIWLSADWPLEDGHAKLAGLIVWAGLYFAAAIAAARAATTDALDIVRYDILPHASDDYARAVADDLERRAAVKFWRMVQWAFAAAAAAVGVGVTLIDLKWLGWRAGPIPVDLLFWAATCFYLAFTASRGVMYGTFHRSFASKLDPEAASLYALGAADTPLVLGLSKLDSRILAFWALIFLAIVAILGLAFLPDPYGLPGTSVVLFLLVPFAGFFSLGYGSFIYLQNEGEIRTALRRFTLAEASPFQQRANALIRRDEDLSEAEAAELERLRALSERIISGGRYGSRMLTGFSIALPLILPVVSLVQLLLRSLSGGS